MQTATPVKASGFVKLPKQLQEISLLNNILPVNDVFYPVLDDESKILLLYGGYGSGKSVFYIDKLINECRKGGYFRCFYGRKVFKSIRISVFPTLTDRIEERGLEHEFSYSKADTSTMIIRHRKSKGTFTPFGADDPDTMKSVKDPSHILCEEMDQFDLPDFGVLISRLRTPKVNSKFVGLFNTTKVKKDHWIKNVFFGKDTPAEFSELSITKVFCNYPDNYFLNRKQYEQQLWLAAGFNKKKYQEIADGEWGVEENEAPFCYTYDEKKHVKPTVLNPHYEVKLSFDFNCDPITCGVYQDDGMTFIRGIEQIKLANSNIYDLCDYIKVKYGHCLLVVTGDATGRARSAMVKDNLNYFKIIRAQLGLSDKQMKQPISNPVVIENRVLVNAAFHLLDVTLDPVLCEGLIFDLEHVMVLPDGSIEKQDRKDPKKQQDSLACCRYYLNTFFKHILKIV